MKNELIERIDEWLATHFINAQDTAILFSECKAEIERLDERHKESLALGLKFAQDRETSDAEIEQLSEINASLRTHNEGLDAECARLEKAQKYVPMSNADFYRAWKADCPGQSIDGWDDNSMWDDERDVEAEVIKRAGLVVKEKE